jgi:hypothetical protein
MDLQRRWGHNRMQGSEWPVRVFDAGKPSGGGSGILIDPQQVLTCAHVVDTMANPMVRFPARPDLGDFRVTAEVAELWRSRSEERADLAVLKLPRRVPIRPAQFAARRLLDVGLHDLVAIGFPQTADERGRIARVTATTTRMLIQGEWMQLESLKEFGPTVGKGYSGGAVALRSTLEVVGMITAADKVDRLGLMLPLTKLVEYREDLVDLLPLGPVEPEGHRQLRKLLAGVSLKDADGSYRHAVRDDLLPCLPDVSSLPERDLAYVVARHIAEELFLDDCHNTVRMALARLCRQVADEVADWRLSESLRAWASRHGYQRTESSAHAVSQQPPRPAHRVSVQVERSGAGAQRMLLRMAVQPSGGYALYLPVKAVSAGRVQATVEELLPGVINDHVPPDSPLIVEFIVPRGWLSKPVDEWTLGRHSLVQIGWRHPVVVRDLARSKDREQSVRWANMIQPQACSDVVHWVRCQDETTAAQLTASLARQSQRAVLALANPPTPPTRSSTLRAGFESGIPAILWHRIPCRDHDAPEHGTAPCEGRRFEMDITAELNEFLTHSWIFELPDLIQRLRATAGETSAAQPHCGRALTLLWDPPEQLTPPPLLALANPEGASG